MTLFDDLDLPGEAESQNEPVVAEDGAFHIALTGHRPHKLDGYDLGTDFYAQLRYDLRMVVEDELSDHQESLALHSGLALGADTVWSEVILFMRERYPDRIRFVAEVPFMGQSARWISKDDRAFWQKQVDEADVVRVYADEYSPRAMQSRNEGMIRSADLVIAIWDGSQQGGTAHAVRFARSASIKLMTFKPDHIRERAIKNRHHMPGILKDPFQTPMQR